LESSIELEQSHRHGLPSGASDDGRRALRGIKITTKKQPVLFDGTVEKEARLGKKNFSPR